VLGMVDTNTLGMLGFSSKLARVMNAVYVNGMVCSTVENVELEVGFPYIMRMPQFLGFKHYTGNQEYSKCAVIEPYVGNFKIVRPLKIGYLKMNALCIHPTISKRCEVHSHVYPVRMRVVYPEQTWLFSPTSVLLKSLPKFFSLEVGFFALQVMKGHNCASARHIIDGLLYDVRVKIHANWVFNPGGHNTLFEDDSIEIMRYAENINDFFSWVCGLPIIFNSVFRKNRIVVSYVSVAFSVKYIKNNDCFEYIDKLLYEQGRNVDQRVLMCQLMFRCNERFGITIYDKVEKQLSWVLNFIKSEDFGPTFIDKNWGSTLGNVLTHKSKSGFEVYNGNFDMDEVLENMNRHPTKDAKIDIEGNVGIKYKNEID